jgi:hypothetical protein
MIEQGVQRFADLTERYIGAKRDQAVADASAKAAYAQAQAQAIQAQAHVQAGFAGLPEPPPPPPEATQAAQPAPGSTGPAMPGAARKRGGPADTGIEDPKTGQTVGKILPMARALADEQLFGPALPEIQRLRAGVRTFIDNLASRSPQADQHGQPQAPQTYRDDVVAILMRDVQIVPAQQQRQPQPGGVIPEPMPQVAMPEVTPPAAPGEEDGEDDEGDYEDDDGEEAHP